jgi:Domain of unknown function (DUF5666)
MSTNAPSASDPTPASVRRGPSTPTRRILALAALGVAAVTLAACGSSSSASTTSTTSTTKAKAAGGGRGFGAGGARPGTSGTIAAITGTSLEVQNPTSGQTTVTYTSATTFDQTVSAAASGLTVGSCISAFGKPTSTSSTGKSAFGGPVTATTVTISQPVSGSCTAGFGGGGFGAGGAGRPGGFTGGSGAGGRTPSGAGRFRGGAGGQFGAASGQVTAVSGSTATVSEVNPSTKATSSVVITLTASTTYTERTSATAADLAVGQCATAIGTADSTGAVTARSISLSQPVSGSCTSGFGGFGRFGGGGGAPGQGGSTGA